MKKLIASSLALLLTLLAACGPAGGAQQVAGGGGGEAPATQQAAAQPPPAAEGGASYTLRILGPGLLSEVTRTGALDILTGTTRPGYEVLLNRWAEVRPDVELDIVSIPWDGWRAAITTAALQGGIDIVTQGASVTYVAEPLTRFLAATPGLEDQIAAMGKRRTDSDGYPLSTLIPFGMSITSTPSIVVVDLQIFEDFGHPVPGLDWTPEDMLAAARATTGINPRTGVQNYGLSMFPPGNANFNYIWTSRLWNAPVIQWGDTLAETTFDYTVPEAIRSIQFIYDLSQYQSVDFIEGMDRIMAGTENNYISMVISNSAFSMYNQISTNGLSERFMYLPLPLIQYGPNAGRTASQLGDWNMSIARNSEQQELAWEFIVFMVTDPVMQQWFVSTFNFPNNLAGLAYLQDAMHDNFWPAIEIAISDAPFDYQAATNDHYCGITIAPKIPEMTNTLMEMFMGNITPEGVAYHIQSVVEDFLRLQLN